MTDQHSTEFQRDGSVGQDMAILLGASSVSTFEHLEGSAIIFKLKTEDRQQAKHTQELVVMPEVALALARALLAALVRMGHGFDDEEPAD